MDFSQSEKKWLFRRMPGESNDEQLKRTALALALPETIVKILALRGISAIEQMRDFLVPSLQQLPRPFLMKGMTEAVEILQQAIRLQKPVTVFGDFDADGVTSIAVITLFLAELGVPLRTYIPERLGEGYGLNSSAVKKIHADNLQQWGEAGILLTEIVEEARNLGFTIIITDHHKPPEKLPEADAILNPLQPDCNFPCKNLAGVGVAFYLILGLRSSLVENSHWSKRNIPNLKVFMDLVAIGTVADQVSITGCNRIIVKAGLEVLNQSGRIGLQKLLETATRNNSGVVTVEDIVYRIAPRINAAGRVGSAHQAVKLMTTNSPAEAKEFAEQLEKDNNSRKNIESSIFTEAVQMASSDNLAAANTLVLYNKEWHQGVLGIVASKLCDKFYRPVILLTDCPQQQETGNTAQLVKGSGRSIEGIDIHEAVSSCREILLRFGGHAGAVGLTLPAANIELFRQQIDMIIGNQKENGTITPGLLIDMEITLDALQDHAFLAAYTTLSPFGSGFPEPVFTMTRKKLSDLRLVGGNHLRFSIMENDRIINGIGFGFGDLVDISQNSLMDLAFTLRLNSFMGQQKWELSLVDLHPSIP
jgi:single-stranded-DNA-specific exonuclease